MIEEKRGKGGTDGLVEYLGVFRYRGTVANFEP